MAHPIEGARRTVSDGAGGWQAGHTILAGPAWRPSSRAKLLWAIVPAAGWAAVLAGESVWVAFDGGDRLAQLLTLVLTVVLAVVHVVAIPWWRFAVHRWEITDEAVYTRTGWLTQESRVAPISRVQTVDTQRGPLERLLGLATVTVTTASSAGAVRITALDLPVAERTVAQLTEIAAAHLGGRHMTEVLAPRSWQRLNARMLLLHPVRELVRYVPLLVAAVIFGSRSDNPVWGLVALVAIVGLAIGRWYTTTYRIGAESVQLRQGLFQRRTLTVPRSRIRSVDVHADLMHRLLGLVVLAIGTGGHASREERFHLDGVDVRQVAELRALLLERGPESDATQPVSITEPATGERSDGIEIAHWRADWVRYAPLSLTGLAIIGPVVGVAFKFGLAEVLLNSRTVQGIGAHSAIYIATAVVIGIAVLVAAVAVLDCIRYLTTYFGLTVTDDGHTLHIRHGLLTTRQTTLDLARLRGATVQEPLLLRLAGGAELEAVMTGTGARQTLLPQAPRVAVERTLAQLLTVRPTNPVAVSSDSIPQPETAVAEPMSPEAAAPATVALVEHGPRARRRRYTRAVTPVLAATLLLALVAVTGVAIPLWVWTIPAILLPLAAALARDRYRGLGHAILPATAERPTWLITRHGSLARERNCLTAPGIIGWTIRRTFWQRRAGLATLIAATAAGKKHYRIIDVPIDRVWTVIEAVTPGQPGARNSPTPRPLHRLPEQIQPGRGQAAGQQ